jgi:2,3-bisphosphoglycerate-independent phosphoglycerate mutase
VPVLLVEPPRPGRNAQRGLRPGRLADVAPTILELLGLARPAEMTGRSLLLPADEAHARDG